jgi:hypothetical protein
MFSIGENLGNLKSAKETPHYGVYAAVYRI